MFRKLTISDYLILIANLIPIFGVLFFEWDFKTLVYIIMFEFVGYAVYSDKSAYLKRKDVGAGKKFGYGVLFLIGIYILISLLERYLNTREITNWIYIPVALYLFGVFTKIAQIVSVREFIQSILLGVPNILFKLTAGLLIAYFVYEISEVYQSIFGTVYVVIFIAALKLLLDIYILRTKKHSE